jgi:hypothetical protein
LLLWLLWLLIMHSEHAGMRLLKLLLRWLVLGLWV